MIAAPYLFYFGNRRRMIWVASPAVGVGASPVGYNALTKYLSGGAGSRSSVTAHMEYSLSWNFNTRQEMRKIADYARGAFGQGLIYFLDNFEYDSNLLNMVWSEPSSGGYDAPVLTGTALPALSPTPANAFSYPAETATYVVGTTDAKASIFVPCPPGYTLWVGIHGFNGTGGTVIATPDAVSIASTTPVTLPLLPVTTPQRVSTSFVGNDYSGVTLSLSGSGTIALSGMIVQVLQDGVTPAVGDFITGQGHSGCTFDKVPTVTKQNITFDQVGMTAKLTEEGSWR